MRIREGVFFFLFGRKERRTKNEKPKPAKCFAGNLWRGKFLFIENARKYRNFFVRNIN